MIVAELPTGNYTLLILSVVFCLIYVVFGLYAFVLDVEELKEIKVVFFQENISSSSVVYSLSLNIKEQICRTGTTDLIFRLRGSSKDAPLILYRDKTGKLYKSGKMINIGIALPFSIGKPLELDVACDNKSSKAADPVVVVSDIYVRQYPRWTIAKARSDITSYSLWKERDTDDVFSSLSTDVQVWACLDTITNMQGAGIIGINRPFQGQEQILRARSIAQTFCLTKEDASLRQKAAIGFRSLHYLFSLSSKWHDAWSDFSRLDLVFVLLLDQLAGIAAVSVSFAFGLEKYFGLQYFRQKFIAVYPDVAFIEINDFDASEFFSNFTALSFFPYIPNVIHIVWMAFLCSSVIIPLSLMWCRLFREIGGKGFEMVLGNSKNESSTALHPSAGALINSDDRSEPIATSMMLRTLECRNVHSGSCTSSNRRLKVEPMICNCIPDHDIARSVAYARSKMAHLRDENVPSGPKGIKNSKLLHESHTQSTDAPVMPQPTVSIDGTGQILRVGRYCERVVQQAPESILDNAVIAECFEVAPGKPDRNRRKLNYLDRPSKIKNSGQSLSSATLLTEEDATSVKDMVKNFTPRELPPSPNCRGQESSSLSKLVPKPNASVKEAMKPPLKKILPPLHKPKRSSENVVIETNPSPSTGGINRSISEARNSVAGPSYRKSSVSSKRKHKEETTVCIGKRTATNRSITALDQEIECNVELDHHADYKEAKSNSDCGQSMQETCSLESNASLCKATSRGIQPRSENENLKGVAPVPSSRYISAMNTFDIQSKRTNTLDLTNVQNKSCLHCCQSLFKIKKKLLAFFFLVLFQLSEIYLVSAIPGEGFNQFFVRTSSRLKPVPGRMHAALLCSLLCIVIYFFVTIHVIALFSVLIDRCLLYVLRSKEKLPGAKANEFSVSM